ncbi:MAG: cobaltochelatase subunit CobN, partial [Crenarchaeota archaeon]|nr:cobaltochelatase subunit CobN [Thermoproteota archaeon]
MKVALVILSHEIESVVLAAKSIVKKNKTKIEVCPRTVDDLTNPDCLDEFVKFAKQSNVVLMHLMGGKKNFPGFNRIITALSEMRIPFFGSDVQSDPDVVTCSTVDQNDYQKIYQYIKCGGVENYENLFLFLANRFTGAVFEAKPPKPLPLQGIYHPEIGHVLTLHEYMEKKYVFGQPTVGVLFHSDPLKTGDVNFANSLVNSIEQHGANAIMVFFSANDPEAKNLKWVVENYFMNDGKPVVDVAISMAAHSLAAFMLNSEPADSLFKILGVPILKAIATYNTYETWHESALGLDYSEVAWNVAMPEFDGMIITVPIAAKWISEIDPLTGTKITSHKPIPERLNKLVRLSINWGKLRHIPNEKRKVALVFHNYPPKNDHIGDAAGLDTAASAINLLREMQKQGYTLENVPETGKDLMDTIINGLTNDQRWLSADELAKRAVAKISHAQYIQWFNELPIDVRKKMEKQWGKPPGELFNYKGDLLVPGLINCNLFIALQPPRGYTTDPEAIYHSPDLVIPYHYHGYYRWIRDVFKADVIIHFGKHGTMEWLPGKSVGLSESCFPDIVISDLPNVYPYLIDDPGEGTGAKRRSYACLVDYLIPVMHNADSYEDLAKVCVQLQEYYRAKSTDPGKLKILQKLIWETVVNANLNRDLEIAQETAFSDFDTFLEKLHAYLNELSDTQITAGLHIMGEPPCGFPLEEFLVALTRLNNGEVPSLRQSIAELKGYDYEALLANRGALRSDNRTNGDVINELNSFALELMKQFHDVDFKKEEIDMILQNVFGATDDSIRQCLTYISTFLVPALMATTEELTNTTSACAGHYVPTGPSGAPTRGMADILPTGRNFYSIDPRCVPSAAAWEVGVGLGDALLKRYLDEEGKYPETIAIVVWATDCMRTNGDDVAEILYLMGVKPIWEASSGRVTGVEPISLEELKRPRIDVTVRISGLFRDTFPNIIHLLDQAVALVAELKETSDKNYIVKHVEKEIAESIAQGVDTNRAREEACYRIFGDIPGGYGSGVNEAIETKNWKTQNDLANIYVTWGCYVYGRKNFGLNAPVLFRRRLSSVNLTVKNWDQREYDALQIDDTYSYHAGMDNAIKTITGKAPRSYYGDSCDPKRVKIRSTAEEIKYCFRARLVNPKWINSMKRHGYHGAAEFSKQMDYVIGWDATEEVIEDWMYEDLAEKFVLDEDMQ